MAPKHQQLHRHQPPKQAVFKMKTLLLQALYPLALTQPTVLLPHKTVAPTPTGWPQNSYFLCFLIRKNSYNGWWTNRPPVVPAVSEPPQYLCEHVGATFGALLYRSIRQLDGCRDGELHHHESNSNQDEPPRVVQANLLFPTFTTAGQAKPLVEIGLDICDRTASNGYPAKELGSMSPSGGFQHCKKKSWCNRRVKVLVLLGCILVVASTLIALLEAPQHQQRLYDDSYSDASGTSSTISTSRILPK